MLPRSRQTLHKELAENISEKIVSGEYPTKTLLPTERELSIERGVSRTVVREAMKLLESRGLVRIERGRGTVVQAVDHEPVTDSLKLMLRRSSHTLEQLLEVRTILETAMVTLAAKRRSSDNLTAMERCLDVMRAKPGEPEGYVDADLAFHAEIARAAANPVLLVLLEPLSQLLRESRIASFSGPRVVEMRTRQHEEIFRLIREQDADGARAAMLNHLSDTRKDLERHKAKGA